MVSTSSQHAPHAGAHRTHGIQHCCVTPAPRASDGILRPGSYGFYRYGWPGHDGHTAAPTLLAHLARGGGGAESRGGEARRAGGVRSAERKKTLKRCARDSHSADTLRPAIFNKSCNRACTSARGPVSLATRRREAARAFRFPFSIRDRIVTVRMLSLLCLRARSSDPSFRWSRATSGR